MRQAAKSNTGNVIRTTTFQGFIGSPFDPSVIYGCKDASPGQLLAPAIYYAQNGFPLAERNARYWIAKSLLNQPGYKETYDIWPTAPKPATSSGTPLSPVPFARSPSMGAMLSITVP
jgi:hypothetical protein